MLTALMGLPNVRLTHPAEIARATTPSAEGLGLADALHLRQARRLKPSVIAPA